MQAQSTHQLLRAVPSCRDSTFGVRVSAPGIPPVTRRSLTSRSLRNGRVCADGGFKQKVDDAVRVGDRVAESAADLLPASVPRGAAKLGVLGVGGLMAFWLLQKVMSTFLFIGVLGGAAFLWLKLSGKDDGGDDGGDDALADAKRIMDKYR